MKRKPPAILSSRTSGNVPRTSARNFLWIGSENDSLKICDLLSGEAVLKINCTEVTEFNFYYQFMVSI
jgi:hypothetical protein